MSIVRINSIEVPEGREAAFEERFAQRAGQVESAPGFEEFLLLRPTGGTRRYLVLTRWESVEAFEGWLASRDFARAHGGPSSGEGGPGGASSSGEGGPAPVATDSEILAFDVVEYVAGPRGTSG